MLDDVLARITRLSVRALNMIHSFALDRVSTTCAVSMQQLPVELGQA